MAIETLKIKQLAKFSVVTESGEYVNWHKDVKDADKGRVVPGGEYACEVERKESGKGYIKAVMGIAEEASAPPIVAPVFNNTPVAEPLTGPMVEQVNFQNPVLNPYAPKEAKTDWPAKDRSQLIGGLSHDAAELAAAAVAYNVPVASVVDAYKTALLALVKIREEIK